MVFISVRGRVWLQGESANMVESVGNYVKHRRVPLMIRENSSYVTFFVPAISGESVAHSYQTVLAEELKKLNEPVCDLCGKGIFIKSSDKEVYKNTVGTSPPTLEKNPNAEDFMRAIDEIESSIIKHCAVEDIGGFLYAEKPNVKRTSCFSTGYMVPVKESLKAMSVEPQLQSRYALGTKFVKPTETAAAGQMIYYVELSSGIFCFSFDIDTKYIGKYTFHVENYGKEIIEKNNRVNRSKAALKALKSFLLQLPVGAKRTRFNPIQLDWDSIAIAVSNGVWTLPSSFTEDYIKRAVEKLNKVNYHTELFLFSTDGCEQCKKTAEEAISEAIDHAEKRLEHQ